ncbi:hypothetical protein SYNTR_1636 [Candidatus Syntrophocurvum alkaliphilum]|uniref:Small, acid-soluble spore protein H n=1 Tax=Candidatus Syntrophocurvum alkaliphilum TaxID=2293317 RepID=A0A6I6DDM4_9FIRM|nr:H-type small acid-soluble spore protein [Candidatus Syntrophocurvum alkaliphilum]QGU00230.1 hypothetical protein SYNTR_1636 [Candidatus Syntrophocurvum alkaliphilum]
MDSSRAKEIIDSPQIIDVLHENNFVWIEGVKNNKAEVRLLNTDEKIVVPLNELNEVLVN